jgi:hypothetical protein
MTSLTITVNEQILLRARRRALERGTSVNAVLAEYLEQYAGSSTSSAALGAFLELAASVQAGSGPEGRTWTRDDLYE